MADATVAFQAGRIVAVGGNPAAGPIENLGNAAILPGLVNAHVHLDLSDVPAPLGHPGVGIVDFIRSVMAHRRQRAPGRPSAVAQGLRESLRLGTTMLGDIAQPGWRVEDLRNCPCETTLFLELIAPRIEQVAAATDLARQHLMGLGATAGLPSSAFHLRPGLSPHAPYTVHAELLRQAVALSATNRVPLAFHLAESPEEMELLRTGGGPLAALLQSLDKWDPTAMAPAAGAIGYLRTLARAHRALVIHGNYLGDEEIGFLAAHRQNMAVVYCPRSHAWFGHKPYPLARLLAAGATVALGTDSRASVPDLSLLAEMRLAARTHASVRPETIVELGTLGGARALGLQDQLGSLEPGKWANLVVVALPEHHAADPHELLLDSECPVLRTYFRGQEPVPSPSGRGLG
jgi:cytosine/adenosine deaminase-related metal-dependent hydrolase